MGGRVVIGGIPFFDLLVVTALVGLVWTMLRAPERFKAVVLYITFGVVMAICWIRLRAPDLALVEAAIGAGLTGVLLLDTLGRVEGKSRKREQSPDEPRGGEVG